MGYGGGLAKRLFIPVPAMAAREPETGTPQAAPSVPLVILVLVLPVMFIFAATISSMTQSPGQNVLGFFGQPFAALLRAVLIALLFCVFPGGLARARVAAMAPHSPTPTRTLLAP